MLTSSSKKMVQTVSRAEIQCVLTESRQSFSHSELISRIDVPLCFPKHLVEHVVAESKEVSPFETLLRLVVPSHN